MQDLITGEEMTKGDANDPSTWAVNTPTFSASWQAYWRLNTTDDSPHNDKIGWAALDFGAPVSNLDSLYIWNLRDGSATRAVDTYRIYYAGDTIAAFPAIPTAQGDEVDYSFTGTNGWTLFDGDGVTGDRSLSAPSGADAEAVLDLGGIGARYIAIEILSAAGGDNTLQGDLHRVGLNEMAVTSVVPEPSSFALLSGLFGLSWMMLRRRA